MANSEYSDDFVVVFVFNVHQQLSSYGDGATALSLIRQTVEAGFRTDDPWFTRQVVKRLL